MEFGMTTYGKPPVILVHGMWSTPAALDELRDVFSDMGYEVHTPSLPVHIPIKQHNAQTKKALANTSIDDYVSSLHAFASQLKQAPILVGHSMGALLVQLLATRIKCERLILISTAPGAGMNGWSWSVIKTFGHNLFKFPLWKKTTEIGIRNVAYGIANTQSKEVQQDILDKSTFESGKASTEIGMWFFFRKPATRVDYSKINCPVLMISGTEDRITPPAIQYKTRSCIGEKAELKMITGACHWTVGGTHLERVAGEIKTWLSLPAAAVAA
jgi:pimeloyl-ACP methyl ester carboxylesterase